MHVTMFTTAPSLILINNLLAAFKINIRKHPGKGYSSGGFSGAHQGPFLHVNNFLEPYICPYANTCLKISSCTDLKCLLCVCVCVQLLKYNLPILYSIIPTLRLFAMLPLAFAPPSPY